METFLTVLACGLAVVTISLCNTVIFKSIEEFLPNKKIIRLITIIPPMAFIALCIVTVILSIGFIIEGFKNAIK